MLRSRPALIFIIALVFLASFLTACTVSAPGGIAGMVVTLLFLIGGLLAGATQTGCGTACACLDIAIENENMGPCLSLPPEDIGYRDVDASDVDASDVDASDAGDEDASDVDAQNETGVDASDTGDGTGDTDVDTSDAGDEDTSDAGEQGETGVDAVGSLDERHQILEKMRDRLPPDVFDRLDDGLA